MSNFWCRQGEEMLNLYRVNAVASYSPFKSRLAAEVSSPPPCTFYPVNRRHSFRITPVQFSGRYPSHKVHADKEWNPELLWDDWIRLFFCIPTRCITACEGKFTQAVKEYTRSKPNRAKPCCRHARAPSVAYPYPRLPAQASSLFPHTV